MKILKKSQSYWIDSVNPRARLEMHIPNSPDCISLMPAINQVKLKRTAPSRPLCYLHADFDLPPANLYVISRPDTELSEYSQRMIQYIQQFLEEESDKITAFLERGDAIT